ncbi:flagellar type III secretion system protein FlhB [Palleronia sp. LCG004]|uniref:EscU/YscU/HrcU family type III secretion system export apparatus switch protein n=1 Tax=Palleronia sp. LCG004 TaxID=3079304 RepID=UPI0029420C19|nr:flagellar type III secretion system protein FlhB [Palleronia sp. LCG004]WOI56185.1 flagellar type III secretion system protein FlhB [Palleronia sp. LCG004]
MSDEQDDDDKQHDPSQKKLDDARKKGEVPRSADLITTGSYAGLLLAAVGAGGYTLTRMGETLMPLISRSSTLAREIDRGGGATLAGTLLGEVGFALAPWMVLPLALALVSVIAQQALLVTGSKLQPKLNRISILGNAKNKFGRNGLFEFAKSTSKLLIYTVILVWFLMSKMPEIMASVALSPEPVVGLLMELSVTFLGIVLLISICIGGIDFFWQRAEHMRKNRMSHKDMKDEHKDSEGDPHTKQQRRQRGYEIAMNSMLSAVPEASVVVVNPTHYAVALQWSRNSPGAPVCVAKGVDEVARKIREAATEAGVPIHSDPPTARAIHATVDVGAEIEPEHFAPVAVAIRFAEEMRRKAAQR